MSARYDTTSLTLLARVQADQPDAWEKLLELYAPLVRYWCRRCDLPTEVTADVFQETFCSVARPIHHLADNNAILIVCVKALLLSSQQVRRTPDPRIAALLAACKESLSGLSKYLLSVVSFGLSHL